MIKPSWDQKRNSKWFSSIMKRNMDLDIMDKTSGRYTTHRCTTIWTLGLFFNKVDKLQFMFTLHILPIMIWLDIKQTITAFFARIRWELEPSSNSKSIAKCKGYETFFFKSGIKIMLKKSFPVFDAAIRQNQAQRAWPFNTGILLFEMKRFGCFP